MSYLIKSDFSINKTIMIKMEYIDDITGEFLYLELKKTRTIQSIVMNLISRNWSIVRGTGEKISFFEISFPSILEMMFITRNDTLSFSKYIEVIDIIKHMYGKDIDLKIKMNNEGNCKIRFEDITLILYIFPSINDEKYITFSTQDFLTDSIIEDKDSRSKVIQEIDKKSNTLLFKDSNIHLTFKEKKKRLGRLFRISFMFDEVINSPISINFEQISDEESCILCLQKLTNDPCYVTTKCCSKKFHIVCFKTYVLTEIQTKQNPECFLPCNGSIENKLNILKFF